MLNRIGFFSESFKTKIAFLGQTYLRYCLLFY